MKEIQKILIANRGEIALRIMRSCRSMNIETVAIFSEEDKDAYFVEEADYAEFLVGETLQETYLNIEKIIAIAQQNYVDAIHPGYGFLSENSAFAQACEQAGITFIGPPSSAMNLMGDKVASRKFADEKAIPLLKGITGKLNELLAQKNELQFPVIIKASAGGGGKGMRVVYAEKDFENALESTAREAKSYFGNDEVFIERYIENPRHIEVQVLGDQHGNVMHLFERECTIQRRHQKIIEEAPSVSLSQAQRNAICETAVNLAKACGYYSAGTVEFIVDEDMNFFFMEMNTRVQVEHPVTEMVTGFDIVEAQIRIAQGEELPEIQLEKPYGHAIECRIYAEDPENDFRPAPGTITFYQEPDFQDYLRIDSALVQAQEISGSYDPMISKVIVYGETREEAIQRCAWALNEYVIEGIPTNVDYLKMILDDELFQQNRITTNYCKEFTAELIENYAEDKAQISTEPILLAGLIYDLIDDVEEDENIWRKIGFYRMQHQLSITHQDKEIPIEIEQENKQTFRCVLDEKEFKLENIFYSKELNRIQFYLDNFQYEFRVYPIKSNQIKVVYDRFSFLFTRNDVLDDSKDYLVSQMNEGDQDAIFSPIPGTVVKVTTEEGKQVEKDEPLIIVEAMKMENTLLSPRAGMIESIAVSTGEKVQANQILIKIKNENDK